MTDVLTRADLADALGCFWNAALQGHRSAAYHGDSPQAALTGIAEGIQAVSYRLTELPPVAEVTCPICEGTTAPDSLNGSCGGGCRAGKVLWTSANVLRSYKQFRDLFDQTPKVEPMRQMLHRCAAQFSSYAEQHRAKGTPDADKKAAVNEALAFEIFKLLAGEAR